MNEEKKVTFSDYLYVIFKWKKFLILNMLIVTAIAVTLSFLIPKTYKATATVMLPPNSQGGMGGLSSLFSGGGVLSLGASLLGDASTPEDLVLGLFNSRTTLNRVIKEFNLMEYYEIDDRNNDKALKAFRNDLIFEPNEFGMIEVSVINKSPELSAAISNFFVVLVDSIHIELNMLQAKNNRAFIQKRYEKNLTDLEAAEDLLYAFQKKHGIFAVPEQLEASVKAAANIEALLIEREIGLEILKSKFGENSPQYTDLKSEIKLLRKRVSELKYSDELSSESNILFPFQEIPEIMIEYFRIYREVEIQSKIMEVTLPLFEQAKMEEHKSIPTILIIDEAVPPELKYKPKKAFIILSIFSFFLFLHIPFLLRAEKIATSVEYKNPLVEREFKIYSRIISFYRLKI